MLNGTLRVLDATIASFPRRTVITGAYAINARGRIAVMTMRRGKRGVAVLDPV